MMLNKIAEWRKNTLEGAAKLGVKVDFSVTATYNASIGGFIVFAAVDGKGEIFVSSQRQDKRVFKTLDALHRATRDAGIPSFTVVG